MLKRFRQFALGILLLVGIGAFIADRWLMPSSVAKADEQLQRMIEHHASRPGSLDDATKNQAFSSSDVSTAIGMEPTRRVELSEHYTLEYYCWWGSIPIQHNYICVLYVGNGDVYRSHSVNGAIDERDLPLLSPPPSVEAMEGQEASVIGAAQEIAQQYRMNRTPKAPESAPVTETTNDAGRETEAPDSSTAANEDSPSEKPSETESKGAE